MTEQILEQPQEMTSREQAWYKYEIELIQTKFNNEIEPKPISIFRRKNARFIGLNTHSEIRLHNPRGLTRHTLLHELIHVFFHKKYPDLIRHHTTEFFDLLKYLNNGGTTTEYYSREQKKIMVKKEVKNLKKQPSYKIENAKSLLKGWEAKERRAVKAIKKIKSSIKRWEKQQEVSL